MSLEFFSEIMKGLDLRCPYCDCLFEFHETITGDRNFREGDASFCIECGNVGMFVNSRIVKASVMDFDFNIFCELNMIKLGWLKLQNKKEKG